MKSKKAKNALEFCRSSQHLFIAAWGITIFTIIISWLISSENNLNSVVTYPFQILISCFKNPISAILFTSIFLTPIFGSLCARGMIKAISAKNYKLAEKRSNQIHGIQIFSTVISFFFVTIIGTMLFVMVSAYMIEGKIGAESIWKIAGEAEKYNEEYGIFVEQQLVSNIWQLVIGAAVNVFFIVYYMRILISYSGGARKDFSNLSRFATKSKKETKPQKIEPKKIVDDTDDQDL